MHNSVMVLVMSMPWMCRAAVIPVSRESKLSVAEPMPVYYITNIDGNPDNYVFSYDVSDPLSGNKQFRTEERYSNGTVVGSYGYVDPFGKPQTYNYVADEKGYRVFRGLQTRRSSYTTIAPSEIVASTESSITWTRPSNKRHRPDKSFEKNHSKYLSNYL